MANFPQRKYNASVKKLPFNDVLCETHDLYEKAVYGYGFFFVKTIYK